MSSNENTSAGMRFTGAWAQGPPISNNVQTRKPALSTQSKVLKIVESRVDTEQLSEQTRHSSAPGTENGRPTFDMTLPVIPQSQLSVNAAEFVPQMKTVDYGAAQNYCMDSLANLSLQDAGDYVPNQPEGDSILERFTHALKVLNYSPGHMIEYLRPICLKIQSSQSDNTEEIMNKMVESLFEQSIGEPNFRYTGARICQYLYSNLKSNIYFGSFHKVLMRRCQQDYDKREELISGSEEDQARLRGLAMFMAEIYMKVEIENSVGKLDRLDYMPPKLTDFVHTLLSHPTEQEVKCCCQLLKLSGALIEDVAKNDPNLCGRFEDIFVQLEKLVERPEFSTNTRILAGSVKSLKESNWNRMTSSPPKKAGYSSEPPPFEVQQEPIFYNPMGMPCTRGEAGLPEELVEDGAYILNDEEEEAFLAWQHELTGGEGCSDDPSQNFNDTGYGDSYQLLLKILSDELSDDNCMGDEEEAAYEEFLQEQKHYSSQSSGGQSNRSHHISAHHPSQQMNHGQHYQHHHHHHHQPQHMPQYMYQQQQQPPPPHYYPTYSPSGMSSGGGFQPHPQNLGQPQHHHQNQMPPQQQQHSSSRGYQNNPYNNYHQYPRQ